MRRHEMARTHIGMDVLFTQDPITVSYSLSVSSRTKHLSTKTSKLVSWENDSKRLIVQKPEKFTPKSKLEFGFYFARAVSEGLLWKDTDLIHGMSRLIQSGCMLEFDADEMDSIENGSLFPSSNTCSRKRSQEDVETHSPLQGANLKEDNEGIES